MTLIQQAKMLIKSERFRNQAFKVCLFGLIGGIAYITVNLGKPIGTFGQKRMLEGEDAWASDDE